MPERSLQQRSLLIALSMGFLACSMLAQIASAESPMRFRVFPMPGGAPVALVNGLVEDREGAVWVATWGEGLHRIQGTQFETFSEAEGLPDDWIHGMCLSASGGVWVGTGDGLALVQGNHIAAVTPKNLPILAGGDVSGVRELGSGQVLAGTVDGTILLREPVGSLPEDLLEGWRVVATPALTRGGQLNDVLEIAPDQWLISLAWGGLAWIRNGSWEPDATFTDNKFYILHRHGHDDSEAFWVAERESGQLYRYEGNSWIPFEVGPVDVNDFVELEQEVLFAATQTGLYTRAPDGWQTYELDPTLGTPELSRLLATSDGALWAGGREGLLRGSLRTWLSPVGTNAPTLLLARSRPTDPVRAMNFAGDVFAPEGTGWKRLFTLDPWLEDAWKVDDSIWMGDGRLWSSPTEGIRWIAQADGTLQTIARDELSIYSMETGQRKEIRALPETDRTVERFFVTAGGSLLYLADDGAYRLDEGAWTPFPTVPGYQQKHAFSLAETEPGVFWAGVVGGIERWAGNHVEFFGEDRGIYPDDDIHAIVKARSGTIWFASMGSGLYHYDGNTFQNYRKADGLKSNSIRSIFEAENGTLWIANRGTGVSAFRGERWVHYSLEHGLPRASVLSFAETGDGVLWVNTQTQGLFRFRPEKEAPDTEILVGARQIDAHGFGAFSFAGRDAWNQTPIRDLQYAWRVVPAGREGSDDVPWSFFTPQTTIVTDELERGSYRFEVVSSDEHGNVDPTPASMEFTVLPPLWMKPGFYLPVCFSILLAALALIFQWISRNALLRSENALRTEVDIRKRAEALLEQHSENLEELVEERTRVLALVQEELIRKERLATLGQLTATVSHELRNPLGTIQSSLFTIDKKVRGMGLNLEPALDRTARSVRRCDKIIEELLDFTRANELNPVSVQVDPWLRDALDDIGCPESIRLETRLDCPAWVRIDHELMRRVFINLLDNAAQAMDECPDRDHLILIRSVARDDRAEIYVEDTGTGIPDEVMERIFEPLYSTKNFGVGLGTSIMRNIMLRHNGGIEYSNREDSQGTRVLLWLPCSVDS